MTSTTNLAKQIFEQLNRDLMAKAKKSRIIGHNLEKGLGNEEAIRSVLRDFLPRRYGVAKGKVINDSGQTSAHVDVILYDAINFPTLFVDEHRNQILPIESVYGVIEVKTTLTSTLLKEAFKNLHSIYLLKERENLSRNPHVTSCPPYLRVLAFKDKRTLTTVCEAVQQINKTVFSAY